MQRWGLCIGAAISISLQTLATAAAAAAAAAEGVGELLLLLRSLAVGVLPASAIQQTCHCHYISKRRCWTFVLRPGQGRYLMSMDAYCSKFLASCVHASLLPLSACQRIRRFETGQCVRHIFFFSLWSDVGLLIAFSLVHFNQSHTRRSTHTHTHTHAHAHAHAHTHTPHTHEHTPPHLLHSQTHETFTHTTTSHTDDPTTDMARRNINGRWQ